MSPMLVDPFVYGGGSAPSAPDAILGSDLVAWYPRGAASKYDATSGGSVVSTNGTEIGRWEDASGNGYHLVRVGTFTPTQIEWKTDVTNLGVGVVHFAGSSAYFSIPDAVGSALSGAGQGELFISLKCLGTSGSWRFSNFNGLYIWSDLHIYEEFGASARRDIGIPSIDPTTAFRVYDVGSATNDYGVWMDNTSIYSTGTNTVSFQTSGLHFGYTDNFTMVAHVTEIVVAKIKVSPTQRGQMYTWLTTA